MTQLKFCRECGQKHNCQDIYRQMGKSEAPSVAFKAITAFLLPILIFIASLVIFENFLVKITDSKQMRTALDFMFAISVTLAFILVRKQVVKHK